MGKRRRRTPVSITPHPLPPDSDIRKVIREELAKALPALPRGATATEVNASYIAALQQRNITSSANVGAALARDPYNNLPFGPSEPLLPSPIAPLLATGRPAPQRYDYPVSWNLQLDTRLVPWTVLRDVAAQVPPVRACVDACKSALTGLEWSFQIDSTKARALAKRANTSSHAVIADLQDKFADDIERLHQWWCKPDRVNNLTFVQWLSAVLEDEVVLDAVSIYPHMTLNGKLHSAELIDSTMIKPLLDDRGAVPQPPFAAYQQIRLGFPRGEYSQFVPDGGPVDREFVSAVYGRTDGVHANTDVLIYKARNVRSNSIYGFSAVEKALPAVDLWLKRWNWLDAEYTAGVTPEMLVTVLGNYTAEQLKQWESIFNDDLSGRSDERHRARFLPEGFVPTYPGNVDAKFASDFDLHILRLICAALDILPTSIGFTPNHGFAGGGGRGHGEREEDAQLERGTKPRAKFVTDLINEISVNYLGMPPEVTFTFHGIDDDDEQKKATLLEGYVNNGLMVLNEGRDQLNLPRFAIEQANEPFIATPTGPAFFNPSVQPVGMPGNLPSAEQNSPGGAAPDKGPVKPAMEAANASEPRDESVQTSPGAKAEQKAFMTFARNRAKDGAWRDFTFKTVDPDVGCAANRLAAAGDMDAVKALFELHHAGT